MLAIELSQSERMHAYYKLPDPYPFAFFSRLAFLLVFYPPPQHLFLDYRIKVNEHIIKTLTNITDGCGYGWNFKLPLQGILPEDNLSMAINL